MSEINSKNYFDWAATAPFDTDILKESLSESFTNWANPSSIYKPGTNAKAALNVARDKIAKTLNVDSKTLFFTSGGTESDHIPLLSIMNRPEKGTILVSAIEHPALRGQCRVLSHMGYNVEKINPDSNGIITAKAVTDAMTDDTLFITVMAVNNETGAISNVTEIAKAIKEKANGKRKPKFHVDFVQALGKIPFELKNSDIDSAAFSAHKIGGPRGIGLLYIAKPESIEPFLIGGGQENSIRSGTENVFGAIAFSKCIEKYAIHSSNEMMKERFENQKKYINEFIKKLSSISKCHLIPETRKDEDFSDKNFSPWVMQAAFDKIPGQVMVRALDAKGFYISTGSACSAKKNSRPILEAMNVSAPLRENAVRFSFGALTTKEEIDDLFEAIKSVCEVFK
ncbi:MAG: cysteine desulfurase [Treponema sp.]|nr:cysteine desulfurase [Candidatus Treponema scatequi]